MAVVTPPVGRIHRPPRVRAARAARCPNERCFCPHGQRDVRHHRRVPTPVLEAPAKVEEVRSDERGRSEETESTPGWSPLLGAIAAADPLARPVTLGTGLETKSEVLLQLQRTVGNTATCEWIE